MPGAAAQQQQHREVAVSDMTKEQKQEHIAALIRERDGYLRIEAFSRAAEVDAELERWGHKAQAPAKRSTKLQKPRTEL
jgi:hypothetical protein